MHLSLCRNKERARFPCCLCSAVCTSLHSVTISPAGFPCICSEASPLVVRAWHRTWLYQGTYSCEHLGLLIQRVWEEERGSAESISKKKSLYGIFGVISLSLSPKKARFLLSVFEMRKVRFCTCLLHLFSQAKTCLFFPLCLNLI